MIMLFLSILKKVIKRCFFKLTRNIPKKIQFFYKITTIVNQNMMLLFIYGNTYLIFNKIIKMEERLK